MKSYFKRLGSSISEEKSEKLDDDLRQVIDVCELCFNEPNEADVEMVLNDIVSVLVVVWIEILFFISLINSLVIELMLFTSDSAFWNHNNFDSNFRWEIE